MTSLQPKSGTIVPLGEVVHRVIFDAATQALSFTRISRAAMTGTSQRDASPLRLAVDPRDRKAMWLCCPLDRIRAFRAENLPSRESRMSPRLAYLDARGLMSGDMTCDAARVLAAEIYFNGAAEIYRVEMDCTAIRAMAPYTAAWARTSLATGDTVLLRGSAVHEDPAKASLGIPAKVTAVTADSVGLEITRHALGLAEQGAFRSTISAARAMELLRPAGSDTAYLLETRHEGRNEPAWVLSTMPDGHLSWAVPGAVASGLEPPSPILLRSPTEVVALARHFRLPQGNWRAAPVPVDPWSPQWQPADVQVVMSAFDAITSAREVPPQTRDAGSPDDPAA